jgi:pimeloyl-ACP methyl ester carboxylesterase
MLPGLGAPGYLTRWARELARETHVVVLDLPGWRWGRPRACPPTLAGIADATEHWLRTTGRQEVVLLGHSTAAQSVARVARIAPGLLVGAVLAGPTFAPEARRPAALLRRAARTSRREAPGELPAVLPSYLHSGILPLLRLVLDALPDALEDVVAEATVPLLVLTGWGDEMAPPEWAKRLARRAGATAQVDVMPGAHNFCFPFPNDAAAAVLRWMVQLPRPGTAT